MYGIGAAGVAESKVDPSDRWNRSQGEIGQVHAAFVELQATLSGAEEREKVSTRLKTQQLIELILRDQFELQHHLAQKLG